MTSKESKIGARIAAAWVVLGGLAAPLAGHDPVVPTELTKSSVDAFLAKVQADAPSLHGKHVGYARYLLSGPGADPAGLRELLTALAEKKDVLAGKRGWITWAYESRLDSTGQPFSLYLPDRLDARPTHPLIVRLHDLRGDHRTRRATPASKDAIVLAVNGRGSNFYFGPGTVDVVEAIQWAKSALPVDPERVYLDGVGMGANGAFHVATMHGELISGLIARDPWPTTEVSDRLAGMPILVMYGKTSLDDRHLGTSVLLQQLARVGAVVDAMAVPMDRFAGIDDPRLSRLAEQWAAKHVGSLITGDPEAFRDDPLYGLFDGRPLRIVVPSGGDDEYQFEVSRMARHFASGANFAQPEPGSWVVGVGSPMRFGQIPIVRDIEVAKEGIDAHWIVLGSPETNTVLAEQLSRSAMQFGDQRIALPDVAKSYPVDLFGIVAGQPNVLNRAWRVLIVASTNPNFFRTHAAGAVVPNTHYPVTRRRPDVAVLAAHVPLIAGMYWTDGQGTLVEPTDPRITPAGMRTLNDLDRLKAQSARRITDSPFSIAATSPQLGSQQILAPSNLSLSALRELIGDEGIVTIELTGEQLVRMIRRVNRTFPVSLFPTDGSVRLRENVRYRLAVGLSQMARIADFLPPDLNADRIRIADETIVEGIELVMGRMGDLDRDGDVDGEDLEHFDFCFGQQRLGPQGECRMADLDGNGRIDAEDFAVLKRIWHEDHRDRAVADREMTPEDLEDWILSIDP